MPEILVVSRGHQGSFAVKFAKIAGCIGNLVDVCKVCAKTYGSTEGSLGLFRVAIPRFIMCIYILVPEILIMTI